MDLIEKGNDGHWRKLKAITTDRANIRQHLGFYSPTDVAMSKNGFMVIADNETGYRCAMPGAFYVYDLNFTIFGSEGNDVQICNDTPSPRTDVYANTISFGAPCTAVFEPGTTSRYGVYHSARLKPGFFAKAGSTVSVQAIYACTGWPGTAVARIASPSETIAKPVDELPVESETDGVSVYPNPSTGSFRVISRPGKILQIQLFDAQGMESIGHDIVPVATDTYEIQYGPFLKGLCVVRIRTENGIITTKVILK